MWYLLLNFNEACDFRNAMRGGLYGVHLFIYGNAKAGNAKAGNTKVGNADAGKF